MNQLAIELILAVTILVLLFGLMLYCTGLTIEYQKHLESLKNNKKENGCSRNKSTRCGQEVSTS